MSDPREEEVNRLDGNAAAGVLAEVFCNEPSTVVFVCAGCGAVGPIGTLLAYGLELGAILRCAVCDTAVVRIGAGGQQRWIDLRGAVSLRIELPA
jgi:uncharacterized metal-binding protein